MKRTLQIYKIIFIGILIMFVTKPVQSQPLPPVLSVATSGVRMDLTWTPIPGATGYTLIFAPIPFTGIDSVGTGDLGSLTSFSCNLWSGAAFYLAVQSRDSTGFSPYSNIVTVVIGNPLTSSGGYQVFAANNLGMHCYDSDFSIFSILPVFNIVNAQVIQKGTTPQILGPSVAVTYNAMADPSGSINSSSIGKTNFWDYVFPLFGAVPMADTGLLGQKMPGFGKQPQPFLWGGGAGNWFSSPGIPITTIDDNFSNNPYPLMNVQIIDPVSGIPASSLPVVVPVSNEMACGDCHLTGKVGAQVSGITWSQNPDPSLQYRENILLLHDYRTHTNLFNQKPVLCASCHYSNALDLYQTGPSGEQLYHSNESRAVHGFHASRINTLPASGNICYYCHPGEKTQCARGAMATAGITCTDCHGNLYAVGSANRKPWVDLPKCQSCHTGDAISNYDGQIIRTRTYTDSPDTATFIVAANKRFAEQDNTLYQHSAGHGTVGCESCHGSPHAEWPTQETNDNLAAMTIQGHSGMIIECTACHGNVLPLTLNGPHGMHNVNSQAWVNGHHSFFSKQNCGTCHGTNGAGTVISKAAANRTFFGDDNRIVTIAKGTQVSCSKCHENPFSGSGLRD